MSVSNYTGHAWHCAQESDGSAGPCSCWRRTATRPEFLVAAIAVFCTVMPWVLFAVVFYG